MRDDDKCAYESSMNNSGHRRLYASALNQGPGFEVERAAERRREATGADRRGKSRVVTALEWLMPVDRMAASCWNGSVRADSGI